MSNPKYQLLPTSDKTPALRVNLVPSNSNSQTVNQQAVEQQHQQQLTEINLNDSVMNRSDMNTQPDQQTQPETNLSPFINQEMPSPSELPSYTEAVRAKKFEANDLPPSYFPDQPTNQVNHLNEARIVIDASDLRAIDSIDSHDDVGSECMFLSAFMISFFFNWIGFFASICLLPNAAGKYGALSGFGLSMAKWVTIVRYQEWMNNMNDFQQKLFFWLFIFLGFYLFFRGLINYMTLKYRPRVYVDYNNQIRNRWLGVFD